MPAPPGVGGGSFPVSGIVLETERLRLALESPGELLARIEALSPAEREEVSPEWLARVREAEESDPWLHGFSIRNRASGAVVGACGFKGVPNAEGIVEIAYAVNPVHQGLGYATEASRALVEFAFRTGRVRVVRAHTKPDNAASQRVLAKCGFESLGEVNDPEDGLVRRWERTRKPA